MREEYTSYRITDFAESERPRERLARLGPKSLSNAELLAILIRVGVKGENAVQVAQRLLNTFDGILGLHRAAFDEVCAQYGISTAKAAQIKAALELGYRMKQESIQQTSIQSPDEAAQLILHEMSALDQEELWVLLLDTRNHLLAVETIYKGSLNSSQVRVGELFKSAVRRNAAAIIVAHNHPSGDPTPSPDDIAVTRAIIEAGKLLDIDVLDHLVVGCGAYSSLKQRGLAFGQG
ncbi:MAG: DNA repair protein RadC [Chloroflexota bacterium]|nr:MAG: DNA repair protein RadC [Chloroflexota bacterium]